MPQMIKFACAAAMTFASAAAAQDSVPAATIKPAPAKPQAQTPKPAKPITIGDAAPAIDIEHWIEGDKIAAFEDGKVYVVEFWATWCGPCKAGMPHLTSLQKDFKDYGVTIIGVSDEPLETVTTFLDSVDKKSNTKWSEVIGYTLTTDPDMSVKSDYFLAAGQNGIPCAFIVGKDQHIEWIGHPATMDKALDAVVKDSWDRAAFKTSWEAEQKAERDAMKHQQALSTAARSKDWKKVVAIADEMLTANPKDLNAAMIKFRATGEQGDYKAAYAFIREFVRVNYWDNAMALNQLAWMIVDDPSIKEKDLVAAMGFAMQATTLTEEKDAAILDTYARCWFEMGKVSDAVLWQQKAVDVAGDDEMGAEIKATLKKYQEELAKKGG